MDKEIDDIVLGLAERAVEVMTYQDLRAVLEALEGVSVSAASSWGILAVSLTTLIEREISRRGLS